jgi:hypothetical protein
MLYSQCQRCSEPKTNYGEDECPGCLQYRAEATAAFREQFPTAAESDMLYAVREAMKARNFHPHGNFTDPRNFSADKRGL